MQHVPSTPQGRSPATAPQPDSKQRLQTLATLFAQLESGLYERSLALRLALAAAVAGESVFFLGPPGVAKSLLARRLQAAFAHARCFDYLMGRFSTPEEVFGPISIRLLKAEDRYERQIEGYLPDADIVFLDEIWKASPPIQNALLTALNEKIFRNGQQEIRLPLKCLIAASNELPSDESSLAFWDRFLLRLELAPLQSDEHFLSMLEDRADPLADPVDLEHKLSGEQWSFWQSQAQDLGLNEVSRNFLILLRQQWKGCGDRRWKKAARLLRSVAFLAGASETGLLDCLALRHVLWDQPNQRPALDDALCASIEPALRAWLDIEGLRMAAERLAAQAEASRWVEVEIHEWQPDLKDEEYYEVSAPDGEVQRSFRIWQGDYEALPEAESHKSLTVDLFFYEEGRFANSRPLPCARGPEGLLVVGDTSYKLSGGLVRRKQKRLAAEKEQAGPPKGSEDQSKLLAQNLQAAYGRLSSTIGPSAATLIQASYFLPFEDPQWQQRIAEMLQRVYLNLETELSRIQHSLDQGNSVEPAHA